MPTTRSSARGSDQRSSPASSTGTATTSSKRKADASPESKAKKGNKQAKKKQKTIEETTSDVPSKQEEAKEDAEMIEAAEAAEKEVEHQAEGAEEKRADHKTEDEDMSETPQNKGELNDESKEVMREANAASKEGVEDKGKPEDIEQDTSVEATKLTDANTKPDTNGAVEETSERQETTPSNILEKGIIYFFSRGRVGIDNPSSVGDIARSYIVLRPLPHGASLTSGPINPSSTANNRVLALPKKVLPVSARDRFMVFVEKANARVDAIKESVLTSSDYETKTAGTRHTPAAAPLAEGVYAITSIGRDSHLAYMLTIPAELSEVQRDVGLKERGSFVMSTKNPQYEGPAQAQLPQGPKFSQEILDEFRSLRWMPSQPKHLDYENAQLLLIGAGANDIGYATEPKEGEQKAEEDTPMQEMEKLEDEDHERVEELKGDDSVFDDLGLSAKEFPKVQTTW